MPMSALYLFTILGRKRIPCRAYRLVGVANHDSNAWEGTMFETYGDALEAVITLSVVGEGFPI